MRLERIVARRRPPKTPHHPGPLLPASPPSAGRRGRKNKDGKGEHGRNTDGGDQQDRSKRVPPNVETPRGVPHRASLQRGWQTESPLPRTLSQLSRTWHILPSRSAATHFHEPPGPSRAFPARRPS